MILITRGQIFMKITVFTPTYNRGYIIEKLYKTLQNQTYQNFEWLVIDDGSTDHTSELLNQWIKESNPFPIRYYQVENGGKHRAINRATDLAEGEMFFIVDSDDHLTEDALECIVHWESNLPDEKSFCGVSGNRGTTQHSYIGTSFKGNYVDATSLERGEFNITGDKAEVFYTDILRRYKFKEIDGEKFMTEATVWNRMAKDGYKIRWYNRTIYICDYLEDGLTNNLEAIFAKNPKGTAYYINQQIQFNQYNLKGRLANYHLYYSFVKKQVGINEAARYLEVKPFTLISAILIFRLKSIILNK